MNRLHTYSQNDRISLMIRHADRDAIPKGSFGNDILLNEKGRQNAFDYGIKLRQHKVNRILTSPVLRCVQTAEEIAKGLDMPVEIVETNALGNPGLHIYDDQLAGEYFMLHGGFKMYEHFMEGRTIPGLYPYKEFSESMTRFISDHSQETGISLFISHDMIIAMYHFALCGMRYTHENWINYLNGITLINGRYER